MKKIMSLAVITALSLGFSGCVNNNNVVKPQCKVYTLPNYDNDIIDAMNFCESKKLYANVVIIKNKDMITPKGISFECITQEDMDFLNKRMKKRVAKVDEEMKKYIKNKKSNKK